MRVGKRVRQLRQEKKLTLRGLAERVGVGFTYLSKVENERLDFADGPRAPLIYKLARALVADEDELLLVAGSRYRADGIHCPWDGHGQRLDLWTCDVQHRDGACGFRRAVRVRLDRRAVNRDLQPRIIGSRVPTDGEQR